MYEYSPVSPETAAMAGQDTADQSLAATDHISPPHGLQSTPKIAPGFDGRISWFTYEEAIDDWLDITVLPDEKLGPSLRNRLYGEAAIYKPYLDRQRLKDPLGGVAYFKTTLRPHFVKGNSSVCFVAFLPIDTVSPRHTGDTKVEYAHVDSYSPYSRRLDGYSDPR